MTTDSNTPRQDPVEVHFAPAAAINLLVLAIMVAAIGASLSKYFGWLIGIAMGLALSYVFSALVKTLLAPSGAVKRGERILAGLFALALFGVTMGLSYGTLYATLFAQSSALVEFQRVRLPMQRQLESVVLANAEGAVKAFTAWQVDSEKKAEQEGKGGGTCPTKAASLGRRGPIAMWRESEAGIAANLQRELKSNVEGIRTRFNALKDRKAENFGDAMAITSGLNVLIESSEALARGSYVKATQETLARQLAIDITWPNGEVFRCGDNTRDELMKRAQTALNEMADVKKNPPLQPLAPAIDLSNPQELTIRGLLRAFNGIALVGTLGEVGSFADDSLMQTALRTKGLINRETLGFFIAGLIEFCVLFTAFLAVRSGQAPFPLQPTRMLASLQNRAEQQANGPFRLVMLLSLAMFKLIVNLFFARPGRMSHSAEGNIAALKHDAVVISDPVYPPRELDWALLLAPYLLPNHDGDYLIVPNTKQCARVQMAARALEYQSAVVLLNLDVLWGSLASYWPAANQFERLLPSARNLHYAVYKLVPAFAQAMRLQLLQPPRQPSTTTSFEENHDIRDRKQYQTDSKQ